MFSLREVRLLRCHHRRKQEVGVFVSAAVLGWNASCARDEVVDLVVMFSVKLWFTILPRKHLTLLKYFLFFNMFCDVLRSSSWHRDLPTDSKRFVLLLRLRHDDGSTTGLNASHNATLVYT